MLHCLRLRLPILPPRGSKAWVAGEVFGSGEEQEEKEEQGGDRESSGSILDRREEEDGEKDNEGGEEEGSGHAEAGSDAFLRSKSRDASFRHGVGAPDDGSRGPAAHVLLSAGKNPRGSAWDGVRLRSAVSSGDTDTASEEAGVGEGFEVYCPPPDDMMMFLRGMSWWEEGMIEAAAASSG